jgi:hypothetical protein
MIKIPRFSFSLFLFQLFLQDIITADKACTCLVLDSSLIDQLPEQRVAKFYRYHSFVTPFFFHAL